ncbi:acyl-CoA N-acyltransferase [Boletus edulis BED1]|uniref:N-alpha-acetyltransferase 40 n=1 Tax=Boletus edulis BED1 TaxID=1328754 RepID=A0AAD4GIK6_BOLED|nr:acyl-CoA N-acyltransferase [Boletus edulis BED1]
MPRSSAAVRRAKKATASDLAVSVPPARMICDKNFSLSVKTTTDIHGDEQTHIWHIFEESMHALYRASSFGWNPQKKKTEMFHPLSRFLIAREITDPTHTGSHIIAYAIFRFEREERQDVLYCYELQVSTRARRFGLGKLLVHILSDIGVQWGMTRVMLTALKANHAALSFYKSTGFTIDESSPDFSKDSEGETRDECDYSILSRCLP